jgi:hypothetical protein
MIALRCLLSGHQYFVVRRFSLTMRLVACRRCGQQWGMNDTVQALVPWDGELEELAREFVASASGVTP